MFQKNLSNDPEIDENGKASQQRKHHVKKSRRYLYVNNSNNKQRKFLPHEM